MESIIVALAAGGVALLFATFTAIRVLRADPGNQRMRAIGDAIREGSGTFLRREYMVLAPFVIIVAIGLWALIDWWTLDNKVPETAIAYLAGTSASAFAGFVGMNVAVRANVRTAAAAMRGLNPALRIAFSSGSVMGITVGGSVGPLAGILAALAAATFLWVAAGRWLPKLELVPFVVTLALWGTLRGLAKGLADNQGVYPEATGWLGSLMVSGNSGLAPGVWILFLIAAVFAGLLRWTPLGRHFFAVGSNEETARLCGIRVERVKVLAYVLCIGCAGVAALLQFSFLSMGDPTTAEGYELRVIAAVVIGGASLSGGEGSILGTLIGALIMVVVDNGCTQMGLENWIQDVVTGAIILAAVLVDRARHLQLPKLK